MAEPGRITLLLASVRSGDRAALEALTAIVYDELRRRAAVAASARLTPHSASDGACPRSLRLPDGTRDRKLGKSRPLFLHMPRRSCAGCSSIGLAPGCDSSAAPGQPSLRCMRAWEFRPSAISMCCWQSTRAAHARQARRAASRIVVLRFFGGLSVDDVAALRDSRNGRGSQKWTMIKAWLRRELGTS